MAKTALVSVSDKSGLVPFAKALVEEYDFRILSTGGTARLLREEGLPVTEVSDYTGFPEMMEGRVKTLHPKVHGGLLARRDKADHLEAASSHGIDMIDLVCVNLYPFEATVSKPDVALEEAIENIDIGGPSMLRSAAKNHADVTVVCDPEDYESVVAALGDEAALKELRKILALKVYSKTAAYDAAISNYLAGVYLEPDSFPGIYNLSYGLAETLRYGENPHQTAALYGSFQDTFEQVQGKALSYNNIIDISAAAQLISEFKETTVGILKHTNPCGVASADTLLQAWERAFSTDRQAPFGGIIVMNREMDEAIARAVKEIFCEVIIAPSFSDEALAIFSKKKNLRLMRQLRDVREDTTKDLKSVIGGILVQDRDQLPVNRADFKVVTERQPTEEEWDNLLFGWKVVRHVKSNAIVYAKDLQTVGVGAGQMSRVDSSKIAVWKAGEAKLDIHGSAICSDAFFPFPDGLIAAAEAGATSAIQPGGSIRDDDVIAAANERGMAMVFTGARHFRHG